MKDAPTRLKLPKSDCPDIWIRLPRYKWPKTCNNIREPLVPLERNLCGRSLAGLLWERHFEKALLENGCEKSTNLGMSVRPSSARFVLVRMRGGLSIGKEKQNLESMWKKLMTHVDLEKPTKFLDQIYLGCS